MAALIAAASALACLAALYAFLVSPCRLPRRADAGFLAGRFAHRGLHDLAKGRPENSLAAFKASIEAGLGMELDLHLLSDDSIVIFHDDDLARACGDARRIEDLTENELDELRLFGTEEKIPRFAELLSLVGGKVPLIVELKSGSRWRELCERAAALLDAYRGPYCVESFDPRIVAWFKRNRPGVIRGQLAMRSGAYEGIPLPMRLLLASLCLDVLTRPHFLAYRHEDARRALGPWLFRLLGGKLVAWTLKSPEAEARARALGYEGVIFEGY